MIRRGVPRWARTARSLWRNRFLLSELATLRIVDSGVDDGLPWVELEDGLRFHGLPPSEKDQSFYRVVSARIPAVRKECFGVARDIVSRYRVPRSLPGQTVFEHSRYDPLRDPLNDFYLDPAQRRSLAERFRPSSGDTFVDVGAYLGFGTMRIAELVGASGKVIAFESDPEISGILQKNIEYNRFGNITVVKKAISDTQGQAAFFRTTGMANSLRDGVLSDRGYDALTHVEVDTDTLDHALEELGIERINFVNMTINGGEVEALAGMERMLRSSPDARVTLAGWYHRPDLGARVCDVVAPRFEEMGFTVITGRLGRVLAWKGSPLWPPNAGG